MKSSLYENWEHELYAKCYWQAHPPRDFYLGIKRGLQAFQDFHLVDSKFSTLRQQYYTWSICNSIYYSNLTEETGLSMTDTQLLTMEILKKDADVDAIIREREQSFKEPSKFRDVVQHATAFKFLRSLTAPLSVSVVLELHNILMKDCLREDGVSANPGKFRTEDITVGRSGQPCTPPEKVPDRIQAIVSHYNNEQKRDSDKIALSSWLATAFVHVHPFSDGNGRMSRLLLNWSLMSFGCPFAITLQGGFIRKAKKNYFRCLEKSDLSRVSLPGYFTSPRLLNTLVLESIQSTIASFCEYARFSPSEVRLEARQPIRPEDKSIQMEIDDYVANQSSNAEYVKARDDVARWHKLSLITYSPSLMHPVHQRGAQEEAAKFLENEIDRTTLEANLRKYQHYGARTPTEISSMASAYQQLFYNDPVKVSLSEELILQTAFHISGTRGYRTIPAYSGAHLFPEPGCIQTAVKIMVLEFNQAQLEVRNSEDAIVGATKLMYEILALHPVDNGNGRLSRLLLCWVLRRCHVPFCVDFSLRSTERHHALIVDLIRTRMSPTADSSLVARVQLSIRNAWAATCNATQDATH